MTKKEAFYSILTKHDRIISIFNRENIIDFFRRSIPNDGVHDNGGDEIIIEPSKNTYDSAILRSIAESLEKQVFSANKTLAAHSFRRSERQDNTVRFTVSETKEDFATNISVATYQASRWANLLYDYDFGGKETLYIAYQFYFNLDDNFNLIDAYIDFVDLNEIQFQVYPENEIDLEEIKENIRDDTAEISKQNKSRWVI